MNARRLQREIIRRRRRTGRLWWEVEEFTRITTPSGVRARVLHRTWQTNGGWGPRHASYTVTGATVYGPWPPTTELLRELGRWA